VKTLCKVDSPDIVSIWSSRQKFTTSPLRLVEETEPQNLFEINPNPAEDHSTIEFSIAHSSHVSIKLFDASANEIITLVEDDVDQGSHVIQLNLKDFSQGIYFAKLISDCGTKTLKLQVQ